jgi:hypothetical protein
VKTLVLGPSRQRFLPDDISVGWRIICRDGAPYDLWWGSTTPGAVDSLIADARRQHGEVEVLDLRERPEDVRDSRYYSTPTYPDDSSRTRRLTPCEA